MCHARIKQKGEKKKPIRQPIRERIKKKKKRRRQRRREMRRNEGGGRKRSSKENMGIKRNKYTNRYGNNVDNVRLQNKYTNSIWSMDYIYNESSRFLPVSINMSRYDKEEATCRTKGTES